MLVTIEIYPHGFRSFFLFPFSNFLCRHLGRYKPPPADGRWRGASDDVLGFKSTLAWLSDKIEERVARRRARMGGGRMGGLAYSKLGLSDDLEDDEELGINGGFNKRRAYGSRSNLENQMHGSSGFGDDQQQEETITL